MEDKQFFDYIYQGWSRTTGAEDRFYVVEPTPDYSEDGLPAWTVWAVAQDESRNLIAFFEHEHDADWFAGLHGCFADLTRRLHEAVDDAERYDCEKDRVISEMAQVVIENEDLRERLKLYE